MNHFDVVVLGAGSAGEYIANTLSRAGKNVALIERLRVGGQCAYLSCMPSKSMLRSAQVRNDAKQLVALGASTAEVDLGSDKLAFGNAALRRNRITDQLDDSGAASGVKAAGVTLLRGNGVFVSANAVRVEDETLGSLAMQNVFPRLSASPGRIEHTGPALGEHTDSVLGEWLGLDAKRIGALRERGII